MNIHLLQRLQLLLQLIKDDRLCVTARENLAAAKELIDTAYTLGDIETPEYRHLRSLCTHAHIGVASDELSRSLALPRTVSEISNCIRAAQDQQ